MNSIRGIDRVTVEQDTTTGLYVLNATVLIRATTASDALRQLEDAITHESPLASGFGIR